MTPQEASSLAVRTLAAIDARWQIETYSDGCRADQQRVMGDLAGLRLLHDVGDDVHPDARRCLSDLFTEGLRRTAALYEVTP